MKISRKRKIGFTLLGIFSIMIIGSAIYLSQVYPAMTIAKDALNSDSQVIVSKKDWYEFQPANINTTTGVILYPGGQVDPESYAVMAHNLADQGFLVVIAPMLFNLAVFSPNKAANIIPSYPNITKWAIAGHSLGGVMAAQYASANPDQIWGIIFFAAYPADNNNLTQSNFHVLSIYGSLDGVLTKDIPSTENLLPMANTTIIKIEGGNHCYFGYYGDQKGDNAATITREEQHRQTVEAISTFLR